MTNWFEFKLSRDNINNKSFTMVASKSIEIVISNIYW